MSKSNFQNITVPEMITQARKQGQGHNIIIEILIFILVFIIAALIESVILIIPLFIYIFKDEKLQSFISSGNGTDFVSTYSYIMNLVKNMPAYLSCLSLYATAAMILTVLIYCKKIEKLKLSTLGFIKKHIFSEYIKGLLVGFIMFMLVIILNIITGSIKHIPSGFKSADLPVILLFFLGFVVQGASEEILCRGYLCVSVARRSSLAAGVAVSSIAFSTLHLANPGVSLLALVNIVLFGIFMALYMIKFESLWGVCAIHSVWNFTQGNLFGMNVSGSTGSSSVLAFENIKEKDIWNGGSFGPEGGICVTVVLVAALLILLFVCKNKQQSEVAS